MIRIRWTVPASEDLKRIVLYIRRENPEAARRVAETIYQGCAGLSTSPNRGRKGEEAGTQELVFAPLPYIAVYRVTDGTAEIVRIWHGAQQRNS